MTAALISPPPGRRPWARFLAGLLLAWMATTLAPPALAAGRSPAHPSAHAHLHGLARLDVAAEPGRLILHLESPLASVLGFERPPRTDAERALADAVVARLRSGAVFRVDPAAQCRLAQAEISSSALKLGAPSVRDADGADGHADIDADYDFVCAAAILPAYVDVDLFDFQPLQQLQVQVATPRAQFQHDLRRPSRRIELSR
ncbi:DUF2796 domain-containing protein [Ideonella sp. DXS29W]|uniref:DUF2796 domain-containing protein n=1 Tax=Ideonella lacteola TaxID=2984193 RepID=A0ABU9BNG7_9BURK